MRGINKENIMAVCAIALCFLLTLGACVVFSGKGLISTVTAGVEAENVFAVAIGGYDDMTLARSTADLIKSRGGAGYVIKDETIEIVYAVYASQADAEKVLETLGDSGAYVKKIEINKSKLKWAKTHKSDVESALSYYKVAFTTLYETSNALNAGETTLDDAQVKIAVLKHRLEDIREEFYAATAEEDGEKITEIKLALVTAIALADNISLASEAKATSDMRYQLVQLVLCRQALMTVI